MINQRTGRWAVAAAMTLTGGWWAAAQEQSLDAESAVQRALSASSVVAAADAEVVGAGAHLARAAAGRLPIVAATFSAARLSSVPEFKAPLAGPDQPPVTIFPDIQNQFSLGISLSQRLYSGGAVSAEREAAARELVAAQAAARSTRSEVAYRTRVAYWTAVAAMSRREAATARMARAERLVEDTRSLLTAGLATRSDLLSAEAQLAAARVATIKSDAEVSDSTAELASLLDFDPSTTTPAIARPSGLPKPPTTAEELLNEARANRPDLHIAEEGVAALEARENAARAPGLPSVAATFRVDESRPNQRYLPLADEWHDSWSIGVTAGWTLWDGGRTRALVAATRAQREAAAARLQELQRQTDLQVVVARRALLSTLATVAAAETSQRAAVSREDAVRDRYQEGTATVADVLAAQADLAAAENEVATSYTAAWVARARLDRLVGR